MKKVPLQNTTPVDLDFQVRFIERHVSISASPLEGINVKWLVNKVFPYLIIAKHYLTQINTLKNN